MAASSTMKGQAAPLKPVSFGALGIERLDRADGTTLVRPATPLGPYPERLTDRLFHWAEVTPDALFMAERGGDGAWKGVTYAQALSKARAIAGALLGRGLGADRPVAVLSGNSVSHALIGLGAMMAGVPYCPVSPAYSLVSRDYAKLDYVLKLLTPGLIFVEDTAPFLSGFAKVLGEGVEVAALRGDQSARRFTPFETLASHPDIAGVAAAHAKVSGDTIAKFLLTSGSTGMPKAVINTQRMLCANQVMIRDAMSFLKEKPPVIVDWLPWNHTFGGNHNVGLVLYNGGTLYIDDGRPVPGGMEGTIRNLREIAPSVYFNVPKGYEMLAAALKADSVLRKTFFSGLEAMFFAGAALSAHIWQALDEQSVEETGYRVPMLTGLGATETAPYAMAVLPETSRSGHVGNPVPGNEIKLVPNAGKLEVRVRGPNITPGYWRAPDLTAKAFDEEGFYCLGDALKPVDAADYSRGFDFDGRISEDFKLASGTWVSVGPLRARYIGAFAPFIRDVVIAGINRDDLGAIAILDPDGCKMALPELSGITDIAELAKAPALVAACKARLTDFAKTSTGSASAIRRMVILDAPPSIDVGEITDKGSINQRAVLEHRAALVEALYAPSLPDFVIST